MNYDQCIGPSGYELNTKISYIGIPLDKSKTQSLKRGKEL